MSRKNDAERPVSARKWRDVKEGRLDPHAVARVSARAQQQVRELTLKELRLDLDLTQQELARAADMTQSELSRLEGRADHLVSSLRRYVQALGGDLEVTAVIRGRRVKLTDV